ncbi:hypothetical protein ACCO45_000887 [Purpureocillium lilacinum]|uniref:Uncharacterized protein n=1 Tax=Purpureocillium lilacinum TaxID=33203 RepID=A0ACC4E6C5_PURLI
MGSLDPIPYWHYNVPEADRTPDDKDRRIVGSPDSSFTRLTWAQVRALIAANELERFQRVPSQLRRYKAYTHRQAAAYGSVAAFILGERLRWQEPIVARGLPFQHPDDDVRIIFNDWPYGLDKRIVHLVVWTKFELESDPTTGDLTDKARAAIDNYVSWFKNWSALKSIHAVEHFHVMLFDPDPTFIHEVTNGDVPQCEISDV